MANNIQITNAEYVEVLIPSGNTKQSIFFPDLPNLRNKPITGIEAYSFAEQSVSNSGQNVVLLANFKDASVTLYYDGGEYIVVPIYSLRRIANNTTSSTTVSFMYGDIPNLAGQNIVWTKSYVSMNANVSEFAGKAFVFNVYYKR
jgi:hypothetical protein